MLMIYNDKSLLDALPRGEFDSQMRYCLAHADELRDQGKLLDAQILAMPSAAKSVRVRNGRQVTTDGPFAETKEMIAGFNVIEADNMDEAVRMAAEWPWAQTGCVEVRPISTSTTSVCKSGRRRTTARAPLKRRAFQRNGNTIGNIGTATARMIASIGNPSFQKSANR